MEIIALHLVGVLGYPIVRIGMCSVMGTAVPSQTQLSGNETDCVHGFQLSTWELPVRCLCIVTNQAHICLLSGDNVGVDRVTTYSGQQVPAVHCPTCGQTAMCV